jgi:molybdopterin synthase sulfur carrier subunit
MVTVEFLGPINKNNLEIEISNLNQLSNILKNDDEVSSWLEKCAVAINDKIVQNINQTLDDGDKVSLLPPVCGG